MRRTVPSERSLLGYYLGNFRKKLCGDSRGIPSVISDVRRRISSFLETEPIILGAVIGSKERRAPVVLDLDCLTLINR